MTWEGLSPPYATIVADPPWPYPEGSQGWGERKPLHYSTMEFPEMYRLPVAELARPESYLFLWATNRYLPAALELLDGWGFTYRQTVTWCKSPLGNGHGGMFATTTEFLLIGQAIGRAHAHGKRTNGVRVDTSWFEFPRRSHSVKPPEMYDVVERVSPGPYLELFARQPRLGWDSWGYGYEKSA